jgi:hypothetical protein
MVRVGERDVTAWAVEIFPGAMVQILETELALNGRETLSQARQEYAGAVASMEQTTDAHLEMAGWCLKYGLTDLAAAHFRRVLDIDPDNNRARVAAGYDKDQNGRWVKKEVIMGDRRGKVLYKGSWRFPESVLIEQNREAEQQRIADATKNLVRWHRTVFISSGRAYEEAIVGLQQIQDPLTIGTLSEYLLDARKPAPPNIRLLYVRLLSQFDNYDASRALAQASILDPLPNIRNACFDALSRFGREAAIPIYLGYLRSDNNLIVNIAAEGLGQLRATSAVLALINALETKHVREVGSDSMNASPTSGSFSMGSKKTEEIMIRNQSVLGTLSQLTGQSFGFDRQQWLAWYASVHAPSVDDLRRDP